MPLAIPCPKCSKRLKLPGPELLGKKAKCPACEHRFVLALPSAAIDKRSQTTTASAETTEGQTPQRSKKRDTNSRRPKATSPKPESIASTPKTATPQRSEPVPSVVEVAPLGLEARYIFDQRPAKQPGAAAVTEAPTAPVERSGVPEFSEPTFEEPATEEPAFNFDSETEAESGEASGDSVVASKSTSDDPIASFRAKRAAKRKRMTVVGVAGAVVLAIVGSVGVMLFPSPAPPPQTNVASANPNQSRTPLKSSIKIESPTRGEQIPTTLLPAGVGILTHLRPAELWSESSPAASMKEALPPSLRPWAETTIRKYAQRDVREISELTVGLVLGARGVPPQVAVVVRTTNPTPLGELIQQFPGEIERFGEMRLIVGSDRAVFIKDESTFAICPPELAEDLPDSATKPSSYLSPAIANVVEQTDRDRFVSFVFGTDDFSLHGPAVLPDAVVRIAESAIAPLGDPEAIAWSFHATEHVYSEIVVQPRAADSVVATEQKLLASLRDIPESLASKLRLQNPNVLGVRELVGRFPAMLEAARRSTDIRADTRNGVVDIRTLLPGVAGPNVVLGSVLTYNVLANAPTVVIAAAEPVQPAADGRSLAEKLQTKVDGEFTRTPLYEAIAYLAEEGNFDFELDGDALKLSGYTQNMAQTFNMGEVTVIEALRQITAQYDQMAVVVDEQAKKVILLTKPVAESRGLTIYEF